MRNMLVIWFDSNLDPSMDDYQTISTQLENFGSDVHIFQDSDQCIDFLTDIRDEQVWMVVKSDTEQGMAPLIFEIPHLEGIYIYCDHESDHERWLVLSSKFHPVSTQMSIQSIFELLQQTIRQHQRNSIAISFARMDELEPSFMYTQILKEILLDVEYDQRSVDNVVNSLPSSANMSKFIRDYHPKSAINWYSREEFIYGVLNRSLRTLETDTILNMGFFIRDLHDAIEQLHKEQVNNYGNSIVLYRGQRLPLSDFEKLKKTKGGLMAFNNFLSTSWHRDVALFLADSNAQVSGMIGILFEITVDPSISSVPFADISGQSQFKDEEEVLFSMHTVFRIEQINRIPNDKEIYQVDLTLTADTDEHLSTLGECFRRETGDAKGLQKIGPVLSRIGRYDKAAEWYKILAVSTPDEDLKRNFWSNVAYAKNKQGDFDDALAIYQEVIQNLPPSDPKLADIYNNIAGVYFNKEQFSDALSFHKRALTIREAILPANDPHLAESFNNMGAVYGKMGQYSDALSYYERGFEIFKQLLPPNHPDLATSYNNMAAACDSLGEYFKALLLYSQALEIAQKSLPPHHPDLAQSHNNIGTAYQNMGKYAEALLSYRKGLEIRRQAIPPNPMAIAQSYNNIGAALAHLAQYPEAISSYEEACRIFEQQPSPNQLDLSTCYSNIGQSYADLGEYAISLSFFEKALEIEEKLIPSHSSLATSYNNIGLLYYNMGDYSKALPFYEKALKIRTEVLPPNHADLAQSYINIGGVYKQKMDYPSAVSLHEKGLNILQQVLPPDHPQLANTYANLGLIYRNMSQYSEAISFYMKALEIFHRTLPADHPLLANCYNNIGVAYYYQGKLSEALEFLQRALNSYQLSLPGYHPKLQAIRSNVENLKREMRRID